MESLRELYRIGAGPSSSHTIGPQRACLYVLEKYPSNNFIVTLYGSLALTGKGHLTDYIIKKELGNKLIELKYDYSLNLYHPNLIKIDVCDKDSNIINSVEIASIGGGAIEINREPLNHIDIYPFKNFLEIKNYCLENNLNLDDFVYKFEGEDIKDYLKEILLTMKEAIKRGINTEGILHGGLNVNRKAKRLYQGCLDSEYNYKRIISAYAYATSEENASGGMIVTAPTCGSCGVVPSVLMYVQEKYKLSDDKIISALAVASVFGNVIKTNASISGAFAGCQSEIGSACSMAAAAIAFLLNRSIDEIECAAEIGMEHHLGLTCDPINGLVQIPCIERNAVAALRAIDSAHLANFLYEDRKISFDTVVQTMYETGKDLSHEYKETSIGGLAKHYK